MCGIIGVMCGNPAEPVVDTLLEGLYQMQHRGQSGCGAVTFDKQGERHGLRGSGTFSDVVQPDSQVRLPGPTGLGHVRYATKGSVSSRNVQPISCFGAHEITLAHNGHVNPAVQDGGAVSDLSDSHLILAAIAEGLDTISAGTKKDPLITALRHVYSTVDGAFACVAMIDGDTMVAFRDPWGIKPLICGRREVEDGAFDVCFASESVVLESMGFTVVDDVQPGEALSVTRSTSGHIEVACHQVVPCRDYAPDIFEYVYFARPESIIDGINVHKVRHYMGQALGRILGERLKASRIWADCVVPVPETSYVSAVAAAMTLDLPCALGFTKTRSAGRTFTLPSQMRRTSAIRRKFGVVRPEFAGKTVIIIDDSIVRGSTSREIVAMARNAGARSVIFASASPAIRHKHVHGIDLSDPQELIAHGRSEDEVARAIGADLVVYLPLEPMIQACLAARTTASRVTSFEVGIFNGTYVHEKAWSK